jgi:hypothetical protein
MFNVIVGMLNGLCDVQGGEGGIWYGAVVVMCLGKLICIYIMVGTFYHNIKYRNLVTQWDRNC